MGIQKSQLYKAGIKINDQETNICENMKKKKKNGSCREKRE